MRRLAVSFCLLLCRLALLLPPVFLPSPSFFLHYRVFAALSSVVAIYLALSVVVICSPSPNLALRISIAIDLSLEVASQHLHSSASLYPSQSLPIHRHLLLYINPSFLLHLHLSFASFHCFRSALPFLSTPPISVHHCSCLHCHAKKFRVVCEQICNKGTGWPSVGFDKDQQIKVLSHNVVKSYQNSCSNFSN